MLLMLLYYVITYDMVYITTHCDVFLYDWLTDIKFYFFCYEEALCYCLIS